MKQEVIDQILHVLWQIAFFLPLALTGHYLAFFWATQWFFPREFVDQWNGSVGWGKIHDIFWFEVGAIIVTITYYIMVV